VLYDSRDRNRVRNGLVAVTALAWITSIWILAPGTATAHDHGWSNNADVVAVRWLLMLAAMMTPVLIQPVQFLRGHGLARRRARATWLFVSGYVASWTVAGAVMLSIAATVETTRLVSGIAPVAVLAVAVIWQCSPAKQICLKRCHERPALAVFGPRANVDVLTFGAMHGVWCIGSCWAWMLVPFLLPGGHIVAMSATAGLIFLERVGKPAQPRWGWRGLGTGWRLVVGQLRIRMAMEI
jgi:predicted metal-binding membrane protein